jgi:hypothetical protein
MWGRGARGKTEADMTQFEVDVLAGVRDRLDKAQMAVLAAQGMQGRVDLTNPLHAKLWVASTEVAEAAAVLSRMMERRVEVSRD